MTDHPGINRAKLVADFGEDLGNSIADINSRKCFEDDELCRALDLAEKFGLSVVPAEGADEPEPNSGGPDFSMALNEDGSIDPDAALDILRAYQSKTE
jgi:hypothetical protein